MATNYFILVVSDPKEFSPNNLQLVENFNAAVSVRHGGRLTPLPERTINKSLFGFTLGRDDQQFFSLEELMRPLATHMGFSVESLTSLDATPMRTATGLILVPATAYGHPHA